MMRDKWIVEKVKEHGYRSVAELGVQSGCTSQTVIKECDLDVYVMVEALVEQRLYDKIRDLDVLSDPPRLQHTKRPLILMRMDTVGAAFFIANNSIDLVFIDASHGYKYVVADILAWIPKVSPGGIICGHDYFPEQEEVKKAVDEIFPNVNLYCEEPRSPRGGNHIWWVQL